MTQAEFDKLTPEQQKAYIAANPEAAKTLKVSVGGWGPVAGAGWKQGGGGGGGNPLTQLTGVVNNVTAPIVDQMAGPKPKDVDNTQQLEDLAGLRGVVNGYSTQAPRPVTVERVNPERVALTTLQPTALAGLNIAGTSQADATTINQNPSNQVRSEQMTLAQALRDRMEGKGPSVAVELLKQQRDQNNANQLGLAASYGRGGNSALAMRTASQNIAQGNQAAAGQAALARAQETATATGQLGGVLQGVRGQDLDVATSQAQLDQQRNIFNTGEANTTSRFNAGESNRVGMFNTGQTNDMEQTRAKLQQGDRQFNATNNVRAQEVNAGNVLKAEDIYRNNEQDLRSSYLTGQNILRQTNKDALDVQTANQDRQYAYQQKRTAAQAKVYEMGIEAAKKSDERVKEDIHDMSLEDAEEFVRTFRPVTFRYSKPANDNGTEAGTTAQSLLKSKIGAMTVQEDEDGDLSVDLMKLMPAVAAATMKVAKAKKGSK